MMMQDGEFQYFSTADFQAIDLPYGNEYFRMTIFLPATQKHIDSLIAEFTVENWDKWINSFSKTEVSLEFPKFTLEYEKTLNKILVALGMEIAFTGLADFTRMCKDGGIWIDEVKHKTFVKVDEEGTEAAAVTSVVMETSTPPAMRVDRPFVFVIRDDHTQAILFIGKIVEPKLEDKIVTSLPADVSCGSNP